MNNQSSTQIIQLEYTDEMIERAYKKAEELGALRGSTTEGAGNFAGYLGEEAVANYLGVRVSSCDDGDAKFHYDMTWANQKIDVKTKKRGYGVPRLNFDGSLETFNTRQKCDSYIFASISYRNKNYYNPYENPRDEHRDILAIHLCGIINKDEYYNKATFHKKGTIDPTNGYEFRKDRYNLLYSEMHPVKISDKCEICGDGNPKQIKGINACNSCDSIYSLERSLEVYR